MLAQSQALFSFSHPIPLLQQDLGLTSAEQRDIPHRVTSAGKGSEPSERGAEPPTKAKPTPPYLGKTYTQLPASVPCVLVFFFYSVSLQRACFACSVDVPSGAEGVALHSALPPVCRRASAAPGRLRPAAPCHGSQQQPVTSHSLLMPLDIFQTSRPALKKKKQIRNK